MRQGEMMAGGSRLQEAEELLRLMASRLSLAAEGRDPEIDRAARTLRQRMRDGAVDYEAVKAIINLISSRMLELDQAPSSHAPPADALEPLRAILEKVSWPEACSVQVGTLRDQCSQDDADAGAVVQSLVELIAQALAAAPPRNAAGHDLVLTVVDVFLQRVELGEELRQRAEGLRVQAAKAEDAEGARGVLTALADLVAERLSSLQHQSSDLEDFLGRLSERLGDVEQHINDFVGARATSLEDTRELGVSMREHVLGLSSSMREATDLEQLKHTVQDRMDSLLVRVNDYCQREEVRSKEFEERIQAMSGRLHALEDEGTELRTMLSAERAAATTDALTGVPNRLAYDMRMEQEFQRWLRSGKGLSLVVLDIDHFKRINDAYGHRAGDKALSMMAQVLRAKVRDRDFFCRYGGEEFVLILPDTEPEAAFAVAEKLRQEASNAPFHHHGQRVPLTLSAGVTTFREGDEPGSAFERADAALYRAKDEGRDRCVLSR